jgi:hypothetical protein
MELERLFNLFLRALNRIDQSYFETVYENVSELRAALGNRGQFRDEDFVRAGERVFCYELYHQFRIGLNRLQERENHFLRECRIQGEVKKWQILEMIDHLGLEALSKEFIPDLLVHSPGDATRQILIVEVKTMPDVTGAQVWKDVKKLNEFVTRFQYQRGVFLSINSEPDRIRQFLNVRANEIANLDGRDRIFVVSKKASDEPTYVQCLNG